MASNDFRQGRLGRALVALAALAATALVAAPAQAAGGKGSAELVLAQHEERGAVSGQGANFLAGAPGPKAKNIVSLPISNVDPNAPAAATAEGSLSFKRGKEAVGLTGIRILLRAGTISGSLGGEQLDVFRFAGGATANASSGAVGLVDGKLRLTEDAAKELQESLGLARALRHDGVGMAWLAAQANPTHEAAKAVTSGVADWVVLQSWREHVLRNQNQGTPAPSAAGKISISGGATATGELNVPTTTYGFPATGGSFEKGLYGAEDKLTLATQGSVKFEKPFHCIIEIQLANLEVVLNGAASRLIADLSYDLDTPSGKTCLPQPPVATENVTFATLNPSTVTPIYSADGKTVTWSGIPATLTEAGAVPFNPTYKAGQPLDPITITVGI